MVGAFESAREIGKVESGTHWLRLRVRKENPSRVSQARTAEALCFIMGKGLLEKVVIRRLRAILVDAYGVPSMSEVRSTKVFKSVPKTMLHIYFVSWGIELPQVSHDRSATLQLSSHV